MSSRVHRASKAARNDGVTSSAAIGNEVTSSAAIGKEVTSKAGVRAAAQRERILKAARQCFIEEGFHAASMARIAETAGMSPGLMYRYFPSKSAIVLAIIDRQSLRNRSWIGELNASKDFASTLIQSFKQWRAGDPESMDGALFLETSAEASRDPRIATALRATDQLTRADFLGWLGRGKRQRGPGLPKQVAESRAILLQCLIEGLALRVVREPDLDLDRFEPALRQLIDQLLAS